MRKNLIGNGNQKSTQSTNTVDSKSKGPFTEYWTFLLRHCRSHLPPSSFPSLNHKVGNTPEDETCETLWTWGKENLVGEEKSLAFGTKLSGIPSLLGGGGFSYLTIRIMLSRFKRNFLSQLGSRCHILKTIHPSYVIGNIFRKPQHQIHAKGSNHMLEL